MTDDELVLFVYDKLMIQGESSRDVGLCKYRGPYGLKCAVGWLIPDDLYKSYYEGMSACTLYITKVLTELGYYDQLHLIYVLQTLHDDCVELPFRETLYTRFKVKFSHIQFKKPGYYELVAIEHQKT